MYEMKMWPIGRHLYRWRLFIFEERGSLAKGYLHVNNGAALQRRINEIVGHYAPDMVSWNIYRKLENELRIEYSMRSIEGNPMQIM